DRVSGPESLSDYKRVTSPSVWIALLALLVLLSGLLVWSIFGRIEVKDADGSTKEVAPISFVIN
ncbi:MAG: NHLP bacteriocin system secretion protein, partial [Clostridia bacterium]|nr:NHLP bacteriocin system secretion protein [Clostridia bacterium]